MTEGGCQDVCAAFSLGHTNQQDSAVVSWGERKLGLGGSPGDAHTLPAQESSWQLPLALPEADVALKTHPGFLRLPESSSPISSLIRSTFPWCLVCPSLSSSLLYSPFFLPLLQASQGAMKKKVARRYLPISSSPTCGPCTPIFP